MGPPCISITLSWSTGEQCNLEHEKVITDDRNKIASTIRLEAEQIKSKYGFSRIAAFKKYSKTTKKFTSCELKNINNGDRICVEFTSKTNPGLIQKPANQKPKLENKVEALKKKLHENNHLSDGDRLFLYDFLCQHGDDCIRPQQGCITETAKKRKLNDEENKTSIIDQSQANKIDLKMNNIEIQCDLPIYTDFEKMESILRDMFKMYESKSWPEKDRITFLNVFRSTFGSRRRFIVSDKPPSATVIKNVYPYLFHKDQVFLEFEMIANKTGMLKSFKNNVRIYSRILMERTDWKLKRKIEQYKSGLENTEWVDMVGSLILLPIFMEEEKKGILLFQNENLCANHDSRPYIQCTGDVLSCLPKNGEFFVYVDNIKLCTTSNLIEAYFALIAAYYIFNTTYPNYVFGTFACLERLYVEHMDEASLFVEEHIDNKIRLLEKYGYIDKHNF